MAERMGAIYGIRYAPTGAVHYVGQTVQKPQARWRGHVNGKTDVSKAIRTFAPGLYDMIILETLPVGELNDREEHWIEQLGTLWPGGLNHAKGGRVSPRSARTRQRNSAAAKRRYADPFERAKASIRLTIAYADPALRAQVSRVAKARANRPDQLARMRTEMLRRYEDPEFHAKIRAAAVARSDNPDYMAEITEFNRAKAADPEMQAKITAGIRRYHATPEAKVMRSTVSKKVAEDPAWREQQKENRRREWADPVLREKRLAGIRAYHARRKAEAVACS